jgi:hypothetical protein
MNRPEIEYMNEEGEALGLAFFVLWFNLAPVAFDHHPAVVMVLPAALDPALMLLGWAIPAAGGPGVVVVVVTMISVDPNRLPVRTWTAALIHVVRWPDAN